jgi:subfamily B ATP-binding cassette protein MsbA
MLPASKLPKQHFAHAHDFIYRNASAYQLKLRQGQKLTGDNGNAYDCPWSMKNPPLLILDEATSSLDTESENCTGSTPKPDENRTSK